MSDIEPQSGRGPFLPLLLGFAAITAWSAFQTLQLLSEGSRLRDAHSGQVRALEQAHGVREAADRLARKTERLADGGDANATVVIETLRKRGITINPTATTLPPPP